MAQALRGLCNRENQNITYWAIDALIVAWLEDDLLGTLFGTTKVPNFAPIVSTMMRQVGTD